MMRRPAVALAVVALAWADVASGSPPEVAAGVRAVLDSQVEAWNRGNLEGSWPATGARPTSSSARGPVTKGWDDTLSRYRKRYQSEGREMGRLR